MTPVTPRVLVCVLALSCAPSLYPVPAEPITDPHVLLDRVAARKASLPPISAMARVESWSEAGGIKGRVTILVNPSGRLRLDAWSPTDDLIASVSANEGRFDYFERGASECLSGKPCPENLSRVLPLGLGIQDVCAVLYGFPPLPKEVRPEVAFDRKIGAYIITAAGQPDVEHRFWIREDGTVVRAEMTRKEGYYLMEFEDIRDVSGVQIPHKLHFAAEPGHRDVTIKYRSIEPLVESSEDTWGFECPQGLLVRELLCDGDER